MKEYDKRTLKIAERVFEKGDKIIAQRRKKAAKLRHISYGLSGFCAALIVCAGAFHLSSSMKTPYDSFKGSEPVSPAETASGTVTAAFSAANSNNITTASETAAASTITSTGNTTTETITATMTDPPLTEAEEITDTQPVTDDPQPSAGTAVVTTTQSEGVSDDFPAYTTSASSRYVFIPSNTMMGSYISAVVTELEDVFRSKGTSVTMENDSGTVYEKQDKLIPTEKLGEYIGAYTVTIRLSGSKTVDEDMQVYCIKDISPEEAVAVRLTDTYEFYLFAAPEYETRDCEASE